ncbi:hypothetical protein [Aliarcobacter butzleri]|uniref:hypothetical protein n=1 Tax=Aliarcobacter butzleri TaxID=28197 RepID=UPI001869CDDA|nr:hypothetical protein [Aliarcobacter butzleri]
MLDEDNKINDIETIPKESKQDFDDVNSDFNNALAENDIPKWEAIMESNYIDFSKLNFK